MFKSFFPRPTLFFLSLVIWATITISIWYAFNTNIGNMFGFSMGDNEPVIGLGHFITDSFLLFYLYYAFCTAIFAIFWFIVSPHKWQWWSIIGSAVILFSTYYSVQVSVAINNWRRPMFDAVQNALSPQEGVVVTADELYTFTYIFLQIALLAIFVAVMTSFLASHYVFRWRTAMNDYYTSQWEKLRHIEGASQRIQEDTMRFAEIVENLGVKLIDSVMTLFAFLPILFSLSQYITELPFFGEIKAPLVTSAIAWSIFGTLFLAIAGIKLPGLYFNNQKVEAAYRKELVYGEDDPKRATPLSLQELFSNVRKNYFRLYFHYMYFNIARYLYLQADNIFALLILVPTIIAAKITYGIMQQILSAFSQVSSSFQYLVYSWGTIVELLSIHKRLKAFEASIHYK